ncbi:methionine-rich copper-binding protein CopC [Aneurinibacillus soli]|uniref:Copper resistance protein CopC n=1 Tax=Aneurinibacillus soli TaxID=1500254 RepID=A0A0U5C8G8_9BACL|nr:copper resistance protein CopC [Aneurinibacillus soli]PYE62201.1 methionine-rich copper-binding protein CopC [Aneurinibacillus soli]BAU28611.1 Copper resistance protein CopC [Aneurinibacillus soli]
MRYFTVLLMTIFLLARPLPAFALTELQTSEPANGSMVQQDRQDIRLTFTSEIKEGSYFRIQDDTGNRINVQDLKVNGKEMTGRTAAPLPNGIIVITWAIIDKNDNHNQGGITFHVKTSHSSTPNAFQPQQKISAVTFLPLVLGGIGILVLAGVIWLLKKRTT